MLLARLAVTLTALAALTACTDDPEPKVEPSETPTSESTSATPDPPETLGPEETVRAWVDARNTTVKTGDIAAVEKLSTADCQTCKDSYLPVQQVYLDGGFYDTDGWRVSAAEATNKSDAKSQVAAGIVYAAGSTVPSEGAEPIEYEVERHVVQFELELDGSSWKVASIVYLS